MTRRNASIEIVRDRNRQVREFLDDVRIESVAVVQLEECLDIEALARKIADARGVSVEDVVAEAIEQSASRTLLSPRRMTVAEMLAVGDEIAALPLLDPRSPKELMEDVNAL